MNEEVTKFRIIGQINRKKAQLWINSDETMTDKCLISGTESQLERTKCRFFVPNVSEDYRQTHDFQLFNFPGRALK